MWNCIAILWFGTPCTVLLAGKCTALLLGNHSIFPCIIICLVMKELSDSVLISDMPAFQQHWNDTSMHHPFTMLMDCWMFKVVYVYMYICKCEYKCLWSKEINVKDFPVLPPDTRYDDQFCFKDMYCTLSNMFQQWEFQLLLKKSLFTWTHIYPTDGYVSL